MSYEEIIAEGVIAFGLSPEEVGNLTFKEFDIMMSRYNEFKRTEYEILRNVCWNAILNALKKRSTVIPLFGNIGINGKDKSEIMEERKELFGE